jgi:predicted nucleic acid-binding protein
MSATEHFIDTNVLLYLYSGDAQKADRAEEVIQMGGTISVQVLNEFAAVSARKLKLSIPEIREALDTIRALCKVVSLTEEIHVRGLNLVEQNSLSIYDAMIVGAALLAGCTVLWSEDIQHGQVIDQQLLIQNPFL